MYKRQQHQQGAHAEHQSRGIPPPERHAAGQALSLIHSEMCIRDRHKLLLASAVILCSLGEQLLVQATCCLLYTSLSPGFDKAFSRSISY